MKSIALLCCLALSITLFSQQEEIILTIGEKNVTVDEFLRIYNKNNSLPNSYDQKTIDEYLDLFINYKLKVIEAEALGYDTIPEFIKEFGGYRDQLAAPYLENTKLNEQLINEAYERTIEERNVSHILVSVDANALPNDTLIAWNKALEIRNRLVAGESFSDVAKEQSSDPSAQSNGGDLGWFNAFKMVYPFETGAYSTNAGKISIPVRSRFGYHVIKVNEIRENRGSIHIAHIYVRLSPNPDELEVETAKKKIDDAYFALESGTEWREVVRKYSEHQPTIEREGDFGWQSTGTVFDDFLETAYNTPIDGFSKPFQSPYGFHLVKTLEKKPVDSFESMKSDLESRIKRDGERREKMETLSHLELEEKYGVQRFKSKALDIASVLDSTVYSRQWSASKAATLDGMVLKIDETEYTLQDFAKYIENSRPSNNSIPFDYFIDVEYDKYVRKTLKDYQKENLKKEYPEYAHLLQEYYDGILLFNISNDEVWEKATQDTSGLELFFKDLDKKHKWQQRIDVTIYEFSDSLLVEKLLSVAKKKSKKNYTKAQIDAIVCPDDTLGCVTFSDKKVERKENSWADSLNWKKGAYLITSAENNVRMYYVNKILKPENKTLDDARGLYIADYQTYLEKQWIEKLRNKHSVVIHNEVLEKTKEKTKDIE